MACDWSGGSIECGDRSTLDPRTAVRASVSPRSFWPSPTMVKTRRQSGAVLRPTAKAAALPPSSPGRGRGKSKSAGHAKTTHYEFMGPPGALAIILGLPAVCYGLVFFCNEDACLRLDSLPSSFPGPPANMPLFSVDACLVFLGWMAFCVAAHVALPGVVKQGTPLPDGSRLTYKLNGLAVLALTLAIAGVGVHTGTLDLSWVHANFLALLTAGVAFAFALSFALFFVSHRGPKGGKVLAKGGNTGNHLYDFFIGRELNPRVGSMFDLKVFCELTPGLIGWLLLDLGFAHAQFRKTGSVSPAMALVCAFQGVYVLDALWFEPAILTTMDVTTDGFGFMLAFGDLVWVPFTYSLQARYILERGEALPATTLAAIVAVKLLGYAVFRGSNGQKNLFRTDPEDPRVAHLKYLPTRRGTRLLIDGWWGIARHVNYLGDWLMAWAWCLPCGFDHVVPYFYVAYFGVLLFHRDLRDGEQCELKYGDDWKKYCAIVKYRLIPYVY